MFSIYGLNFFSRKPSPNKKITRKFKQLAFLQLYNSLIRTEIAILPAATNTPFIANNFFFFFTIYSLCKALLWFGRGRSAKVLFAKCWQLQESCMCSVSFLCVSNVLIDAVHNIIPYLFLQSCDFFIPCVSVLFKFSLFVNFRNLSNHRSLELSSFLVFFI